MSLKCGLIHGKLPGLRGSDWILFYVELYESSLHIFEGNEDPTKPRRQMRSLELNSTDIVYSKDKDKKRDFRFLFERFDGKYLFKCATAEERTSWINHIHRMIQRKEYTEKGVLPESTYSQASYSPTSNTRFDLSAQSRKLNTLPHHHSYSVDNTTPPPPPHKRDSGFISGTGDARMYPGTSRSSFSGDSMISHGKTNSGDSAIAHTTAVIVEKFASCHSDDGKFSHRIDTSRPTSSNGNSVIDEDELSRYDWYWGEMTRDDCTVSLKERGMVGNFVVRKNNRGDFVMSFWRKDTIHHHRILKSGNVFQFEKSVVQATGESIPDLLDTYMKCCTDKTIGPYGGQLYPNYDDPWNPPEIDFNKMSLHLKKVNKDGKRVFKPGHEMSEHTYGGKTLEQMKDFFETAKNVDIFEDVPTQQKSQTVRTPFAGFTPSNMSPSEIKTSTNRTSVHSPKKSPKPGVATPFAKQTANTASGYVNLIPNKTRINNEQQQQQQQQQHDDEDEIFTDDEDQEIYIQPGNMGEEQGEDDEEPLYANTNFHKVSPPSDRRSSQDDTGIYQNFVVAPPTALKSNIQPTLDGTKLLQNNGSRPNSGSKPRPLGTKPQPAVKPDMGSSLYQNVTHTGKPRTQPRQKNQNPRRI